MSDKKEYIPSWHIEDQEWWQKYSAMVNSQQIQVEKTAAQIVDFTTPTGSGSVRPFYTGSGSGSGSLGIRYIGSGSGSGSLGIRYTGSGSGSGSLGIRYMGSGSGSGSLGIRYVGSGNRYLGIAPGSKIFKYIGSGNAGSNAKKENNILAYGLGLL